ncbi:MAG: hypothetical protein ACHQ1E_02420 [Ktedonobacterales bacterium]|jgi:hypothetical protein
MSRGYEQQGVGWDDEYADYGDGAPGQPSGHYTSDEYGGVDPSRALAQYNEVMPPSAEGGLMTGLPGFPQTDEEERAIGMRRPAYIPATEPKRKKKLSSGRVMSGVLSILLVTVGVCGGLGFLGQQRLADMLKGPLGIRLASPTVDLSQVPVTPVSTPGPSAKVITSAVTAQGIDNKYNPVDVTSYFKVNSTVYVVVNIVGASQTGSNILTCRWFLDGIDYNLKSGTSVAVQSSKTNNFHGYCGLPYYQTGVGMVKIYWNKPNSDSGDASNDKYLAQTIKFAIVANTPGTTTPGSGTPKSGTPTPSPTKKTGSVAPPFAWRSQPGAS